MKLTEEQAITKWCPMVRHGDEEGGTFNRGGEPGNAINTGRDRCQWSCACVGSGCMMWRWAEYDDEPEQGRSDTPVEGWEYVSNTGFGKGFEYWLEPMSLAKERLGPRLGYCGLAGEPLYA